MDLLIVSFSKHRKKVYLKHGSSKVPLFDRCFERKEHKSQFRPGHQDRWGLNPLTPTYGKLAADERDRSSTDTQISIPRPDNLLMGLRHGGPRVTNSRTARPPKRVPALLARLARGKNPPIKY